MNRSGPALEFIFGTQSNGGNTMSKSTVGILKMRRRSDVSKLTVAYCAFGLVMVLAQVAFGGGASEFCATTYKEVENSKSTALKAAMKVIREQEFRNKSNGTHLEFLKSDQILAQTQTTSLLGAYEKESGVVKICEANDGKLTISGFLSESPIEIKFQSETCFKLSGGLASLAGEERTSFCHGKIPDVVLQARVKSESSDQQRAVAKNPRNSNGSSTIE